MQCCRCGRQPIKHNLTMYPIELRGSTPNRKWACTNCITPDERAAIDPGTKKIVGIFDPREEVK